MRARDHVGTLALVLTLGLSSDVAEGQQAGEVVRVDSAASDDVYLAGREVSVDAAVAGDVAAAGREVRVGGEVSGDAMLAGESVLVDGAVADDVRAAGRTVAIAAPIGGHLVAAGETISIAPGQRVTDWAWLAGDRIAVAGSVGSLRAVGDDVTIDGEVLGAAELRGETIRLGPNAVVRGDLTWASPNELVVAEGARVEGASTRAAYGEAPGAGAMVAAVFFWIASFALAAALLVLALPRTTAAVGERARVAIGRSLLAGLLVVVLTPVLVGVAFVTGVLWLVGVLLLATYLFLLAAGLLFGIYALGDLGLELVGRGRARASSLWQRVGAATLAAIVVALLAMVPVLGAIVLIATTIVGAGALTLSAWRTRRAAPAPRATIAEPAPA